MVLVSNQNWLKLADREEAGKGGKAEKWMIGMSENVGFKARQQLIDEERKC